MANFSYDTPNGSEDLVRSQVLKKNMYSAYEEIAADQIRGSEALEWTEGTISDMSDEKR